MSLNLPLDVRRLLDAAAGWLGLGDPLSANEELEQIPPEWKAYPEVLVVRYGIYSIAEKWDAVFEIADTLKDVYPIVPIFWLGLADSARRKTGGSLQEAKEILLKSESNYPESYQFPFNLACYCSQLHEFKDAEMWLKKAMEIDEKMVQKLAVNDKDLKPLWDSIGGSTWMRIE